MWVEAGGHSQAIPVPACLCPTQYPYTLVVFQVAWATASCALLDPHSLLYQGTGCGRAAQTPHADLCPILFQGIECLQQKKCSREKSCSWQSFEEAFGGDYSLNWFNPFTRPCQPETPIDKDLVRQVSSLSDMDNIEIIESKLEETKDEDSMQVLDE